MAATDDDMGGRMTPPLARRPYRDGPVSEHGEVRLTLPWDCLVSVNQRTNPAGWGKMKGRQFLTKRYRQGLEMARLHVLRQVRGRKPVFPDGRLAVEMRFCVPDRRRRDVRNLEKLVADAMIGAVYADDSQVKDTRTMEVGVDRKRPRVEVWISYQPSEAA